MKWLMLCSRYSAAVVVFVVVSQYDHHDNRTFLSTFALAKGKVTRRQVRIASPRTPSRASAACRARNMSPNTLRTLPYLRAGHFRIYVTDTSVSAQQPKYGTIGKGNEGTFWTARRRELTN